MIYQGNPPMDELMHYGMPRRSGRYPWGSGEDPYQHSEDFLGRVERLKKEGWKPTAENVKKEFGESVSLNDYRNELAWCNYERNILNMQTAKRLKEKEGLSNSEIGRRMGVNESTVRGWFKQGREERMQLCKNTADRLKAEVDEKEMIDVGAGVERELGVSSERLNQALYYLKGEGYEVYEGGVKYATNDSQQFIQKVLCKPGTPYKAIYEYDKIKTIGDYTSHDGGETFDTFVYPKSLDSNRLKVRYAEEGGIDKDGIVEIRRGVKDLDLGEGVRYAQVRILVDDKKYIKGMAVYSDDIPDGVDMVFNTNKSNSKSKLEVLKDIKSDPANPFGSLIKAKGQSYYIDENGERQLSLINKTRDEGDWTEWKDKLPSQFLGKQALPLAKKQLALAKADKMDEYESIMSINNPTIRKYYLKKFSDECDAAAVDLKAAALPGQKYHVIIPVNSLKDNEIYAPQYKDGTELALIRYPHGGLFEIPILKVNNKHAPAKKLIGTDSIDAVGINKANADRLSGADFDGDTVMCIPTNNGKIKISNKKPLDELEGFDPKLEYPYREGMKLMKDEARGTDQTQKQMGMISNLITDMTLANAPDSEIAKAVRHSMVVIDAGKHKLDYKRSEIENEIDSLKREWQIKGLDEDGNVVKYGGASTLLSKSKGEKSVIKRQGTPKINMKDKPWYDPTKPEGAYIYKVADDAWYPVSKYDKATKIKTLRTIDGKKISYSVEDKDAVEKYNPVKRVNKDTGEVTFTNKAGDIQYKTDYRKQKSTNMAEADDAMSLVSESKHPMELAYASYANSMKALANQARKEYMMTGKIEYSSAAKKLYQDAVDSLDKKLNKALLNSTRERAAQRQARAEIEAYKKSDDTLKRDDIKKKGQQAITKARQQVGSLKRSEREIEITDREWEAIQSGAIPESKLMKILNNSNPDKLRERATPRASTSLSVAQKNRISRLADSGYTIAQIAEMMGKSPSTINNVLKGA